jgi:hypothetical protein
MDLEDGGDSPWGGMLPAVLQSIGRQALIHASRCPIAQSHQRGQTYGCCSIWGRWRSVNLWSISQSVLICANEAESKDKTPGLDTSLQSSSSSQPLKSPTGRNPRTPRRAGAQPVRLQAIDDSLGPLGPLGDNAPLATNDLPPLPPQKEQVVTRQPTSSKFGSQPVEAPRKIIESDSIPDDIEPSAGPRIPPPVQPSQGTPVRRDTQPSVSIEQAAKPSFDISVGDPHKVGDLTSSHIVYLVKTKVEKSSAFWKEEC